MRKPRPRKCFPTVRECSDIGEHLKVSATFVHDVATGADYDQDAAGELLDTLATLERDTIAAVLREAK